MHSSTNLIADKLSKNQYDDVESLRKMALPLTDIQVHEPIAEGNFGSISRAIIHGKNYAVKSWKEKGREFDVAEVKMLLSLESELSGKNNQDESNHQRVVISKFASITSGYVAISPYAENDSLKNFLLNIVKSESDIKDIRILKAFHVDPINFLSVITYAMLDCVLQQHQLNHLHLDVSTRNFLVYEFSDEDFKYDNNGDIIGLNYAPIKITDHGLAKKLNDKNDVIKLSNNDSIPPRWSDTARILDHNVSLMSDIFSVKVSIISMIGLLLGESIEQSLLYFKKGDSSKTFNEKRKQATNSQVLASYLNNAIDKCKEVIRDYKNNKYSNETDKIKYAHAALIYIGLYKDYLISFQFDKNELPFQAVLNDQKQFLSTMKKAKNFQFNEVKIDYNSISITPDELFNSLDIQQASDKVEMKSDHGYTLAPSSSNSKPTIDYSLAPSTTLMSQNKRAKENNGGYTLSPSLKRSKSAEKVDIDENKKNSPEKNTDKIKPKR